MQIAGENPDIILLTEVIPKAQRTPIPLALLSIPNYHIYTSFDPSLSNLGPSGSRGISVYVRNSLLSSIVQIYGAGTIEHLWIQVRLHRRDSLLIGCFYRSPSSDGFQSMSDFRLILSQASRLSHSHFLVVGDFNFPQIDWLGEFSTAPTGHPSHALIEVMHDFFLHQHVLDPTRYIHGQNANILDLIFTDEEGLVSSLQYLPGLGQSDHLLLKFRLNCYTIRSENRSTKPDFNRADFERLNMMMNRIDWSSLDGLSMEESYHFFMNHLNSSMDVCIPQARIRNNRKNIYMTSAALNLKQRKNALARTYYSTRDVIDHARLKTAQNELRALTRKLQRDFELNLARNIKTRPKAFWNYANSRLNTRSKMADLRKVDGDLETDSVEKAKILNCFFSSVFTVEDTSDIPAFEVRYIGPLLEDIHFSNLTVFSKLASLKITSSPGPDLLHSRILHDAAESLCVPLAKLFRKSLDTSTIPDEWKLASVIPIFKKGDKHSPNNYRPVSLTSISCKVLESIVKDALLDHLNSNHLLSSHQHGFRPKRSCDSQMLETLEDWTKILEGNAPVDAIYLDFRKAFDAVPHERLLHKLKGYGVGGKLLSWIRAFLSNRQQRVVVEGSASDWIDVTSGVPQGSVLGPLLFIVYINDLPDCVQSQVKIFADDTKLYAKVDQVSSIELLQADIDQVKAWSSDWLMPFNQDKCVVLHIGNNNPLHRYQISDTSLEATDTERDLGVIVDSDLKFRQQAATSVSKANRVLGVIRKAFANIDTSTIPVLYKTLVRPLLEYGNACWGPFNRADQILVERVQRRATRMISTLRGLSYPERLRVLRLPSLYYRRRRGDMVKVFRLLHGLIDQSSSQFFQLDRGSRTRGHPWKLVKPNALSRPRRTFFGVRIVNDWNALPLSVVSASTLDQFKAKLDRHWASNMYDVPECPV